MSEQKLSIDAESYSIDITSNAFSGATQSSSLCTAKELYRLRRVRTRKLGSEAYIFGDPAWDIMLILFIAYKTGDKVSKSSAALAGETAETTGYRILKELDRIGLVKNEKDVFDRRRILVSLTRRACVMMEACLQTPEGYGPTAGSKIE
ncbi:MarR family transcriptional regulator [Sphingomonas sp. BAUL-RG-20F-R05-02]|uniref:MarR family transcriptional regulator n=1 Tax=Sphingomonas sp. BAUL-RG-20F-R05-02 TaxID=2914830 RepID=UPI001F59FC03|nr:MarR family transcriptional regulator [Sphingomonas sp. BAUL-RG-20F-R05-02]